QKFEELLVIVHGHAPFFIVISDVWFCRSPRTTWHNVSRITATATRAFPRNRGDWEYSGKRVYPRRRCMGWSACFRRLIMLSYIFTINNGLVRVICYC